MMNVTDFDSRLFGAARSDARRLTPAFSEALHARIMEAVGEASAAPAERAPLRLSPARPWLSGAIAAAVMFATTLTCLWLPRPSPRPPVAQKPRTDSVPSRPVPSAEAFAMLDSASRQLRARATAWEGALTEHRWAGLDHDVTQATRFLLDQVPTPPARQNAHREAP